MNDAQLRSLAERCPVPRPFVDAGHFPWEDPAFALAFLKASTRSPERSAAELGWLASRGVQLEGRRVLDLGCGAGRFCVPLATRGAQCVGVDICPAVLDEARAAADGARLTLLAADVHQQPLDRRIVEGGPYDAILLGYGQLSGADTEAQEQLLAALAGLLAPAGMLAAEMLPEEYLRALDGHRAWWIPEGPFPPGPSPQLVLEEVTVTPELGYVHRLVLAEPGGTMRELAQSAQFQDEEGYGRLFAAAGLELLVHEEVEPEDLLDDRALARLDAEPAHPDNGPGLWLVARRR